MANQWQIMNTSVVNISSSPVYWKFRFCCPILNIWCVLFPCWACIFNSSKFWLCKDFEFRFIVQRCQQCSTINRHRTYYKVRHIFSSRLWFWILFTDHTPSTQHSKHSADYKIRCIFVKVFGLLMNFQILFPSSHAISEDAWWDLGILFVTSWV